MAWVMTRHGARGTRYTGAYRDPDGGTRSAGSFSTRRDALRAANREEQKVLAGAWHDNAQGEITFRDYVEKEWLPNKHVEASTRAAYIWLAGRSCWSHCCSSSLRYAAHADIVGISSCTGSSLPSSPSASRSA